MKFSSDEYNDVYYIYIWLNDKIKRSHTDCLINKINERIFIFFKNFFNQNRYEDNKYIRVYINNNSEYFKKKFQLDERIATLKRNLLQQKILKWMIMLNASIKRSCEKSTLC